MTAEPHDPLQNVPLTLDIDGWTDGDDLLRVAVLNAWVQGRLPHLVERTIEYSHAVAELPPDGFRIERSITADDAFSVLTTDGGTWLYFVVTTWKTDYLIAATTEERVHEVSELVRKSATRVANKDHVTIRVWNNTDDAHEDRELRAPLWEDIEANYPSKTREQLTKLFTLTAAPEASGHLILWHGNPGTGKTTAIRALARAWEPWCAVQYISDPEQLFNNSKYLTQVLRQDVRDPTGPTLHHGAQPDKTWRLVIAEDTDDYLRSNAREQSGAALGRVLNLSDGILGQDRNVLLLLTTNKEVNRLHPALVRPGRCLANVEFPKFDQAEAAGWLGPEHPRPRRSMTLSELLVKRGDLVAESEDPGNDLSLGAYL